MNAYKKNIIYVAVMPAWSHLEGKNLGCFIAHNYFNLSIVVIFA